MIVVDASVWVSYFLPQDLNHVASQLWLNRQLSTGQILLEPELLLPEVGGAIARRIGESEARLAVANIQAIATLSLFELDEDLGIIATEIANNHRLRGADAVYVALAEQLGLPLISWDQEMVSRTTGIIQAYTPSSLP